MKYLLAGCAIFLIVAALVTGIGLGLAASHWTEIWAMLGSTPAQNEMAVRWYTGADGKRDLPQAARWFKEAAEAGDAAGQFGYAWMLQHGQGVSRDREAAVDWYIKSADQGYLSAELALAVLGVRQRPEAMTALAQAGQAEGGLGRLDSRRYTPYEREWPAGQGPRPAPRAAVEAAAKAEREDAQGDRRALKERLLLAAMRYRDAREYFEEDIQAGGDPSLLRQRTQLYAQEYQVLRARYAQAFGKEGLCQALGEAGLLTLDPACR
jgi:hypothetical protein